MKFTEHLLEEINKNGILLTKEFHIYAYDLSSNEILVSEEIGYAPQLTVHTFPGKSALYVLILIFVLFLLHLVKYLNLTCKTYFNNK